MKFGFAHVVKGKARKKGTVTFSFFDHERVRNKEANILKSLGYKVRKLKKK